MIRNSPSIAASSLASDQRQMEEEPQVPQPAATSSTASPNPTAGRSMQVKLNAVAQNASVFQKKRRNSGVFLPASKRKLLDPGNRERASQLVQRAMDALQRADEILYSGQPTEENGAGLRENLYEQLTILASEIKVHTTTLDGTALVATPESGTAPHDEGSGVSGPPHDLGKAAAPHGKDSPDSSALESRIIEKCQEVIESLTPLCLASDLPDSNTDSVLDHYFEIKEGLPLGAELQSMLLHAAFAQTVYADDLQENLGGKLGKAAPLLAGTLPESWVSTAISADLLAEYTKVCPKLQQLPDGRLWDQDSGLVLQIFDNPTTKQAVIAFGGTSAGETKGPLITRVLFNLGITLRQWRANFSNATGISLIGSAVPDSYKRAAQLTELFLKSDQGKDCTVSLTGHSLGGAIAEFTALSNDLDAVCFGTPPLGKHVLKTFTKEALHAGERAIRHYFVKGDLAPVSNTLLPVLGRRQAHVGIGYWMNPADELINTFPKALWCHDQFFTSARDEAVRQDPLQDEGS